MFNEVSVGFTTLNRYLWFYQCRWLLCPLYCMEMSQNGQYISNNELMVLLNHISFYNEVNFLALMQFLDVSQQIVRYLFLQAGNLFYFEDLCLLKKCQILIQHRPNRLHQYLSIFACAIVAQISFNRFYFLNLNL